MNRLLKAYRRATVLFLAVLLTFVSPHHIMAAPITFIAQGPVDYVSPVLTGKFSIGDMMSIVYTFESLTPDHDPDPHSGWYPNAITNLTVTVGGYTATGTSNIDIRINNDSDLYGEIATDIFLIDVRGPLSGPSINGYTVDPIQSGLTLYCVNDVDGFTSPPLTSDALPLVPPDFFSSPDSGYAVGTLSFQLIDSGLTGSVGARITSITPEPGSLLMLALGGLALLRRRR